MAFTKSEMSIARAYSQLCEDDALREQIMSEVLDEHELTSSGLNSLLDQEDLLASQQNLAASLQWRDAYSG